MAVFLPKTDNALAGILDLLLVVIFIYLIIWAAYKFLPIFPVAPAATVTPK